MDKQQLFQQIEQLYLQQNWQEMENVCSSSLGYFPNSATLYYNRALSRAYLGNLVKAKEDLEKCLQIKPNQPKVHQFMQQIQLWQNTRGKSLTKAPQELSPSQLFEQEEGNLVALFEDSFQSEKKQFGRYKIVEELGRGGMGKVYKAYDDKLGRYIALKVVISGEMAGKKETDRFLREAKATAQLKHPYIITVYDIGVEDSSPYFTMDLIVGVTLKEYLQKTKRNIRKIIKILIKVGEAIDYAHQQGIIHRDIKPANILITKDEEPLVVDFGLAKITTDEQLSKTSDVIGTPAYMSPEQAQGQTIDKTTDVYALGATLYEILAGRPPFLGETHFNIVKQILENDPISPRILNPEVSIELEAICLKCLEKKPGKRYIKASLLTKDLDNFLKNKPITAKKNSAWVKVRKWIFRHKWIVTTVSLVFFVILAGGTFSYHQWQQAKEALKALQQEKSRVEKAKQEVEKQQEITKKQQKITEKAKEEALQQKKVMQQELYYSRILLAGKYMAENNMEAMDENLDKCPTNLRNWEWGWLKKQSDNAIATLKGHKKGVTQGVFSLDGAKILSSGQDDSAIFWDLKTLSVARRKKFGDVVTSCAFSPDMKYAALVDSKGFLTIADSKGKTLKKIKVHHDRVKYCAFSPNSQRLATIDDQALKIWDVKTGEQIHHLKGHYNRTYCCVFSPNGKMIVSIAKDCRLILWDAIKGKKNKVFVNDTIAFFCAFSPDGNRIACAKEDGNIAIWDIKMGKKIQELEGHTQQVNCCIYSPNGKYLASTSKDRTIRIWNAYTGGLLQIFKGHTRAVVRCAFSADSKKLVSASDDGTLKIWQIVDNNNNVLGGHLAKVVHCAFSPDGTKLASVGESDATVILWDLLTKRILFKLRGHKSYTFYCDFSPDGTKIVSTGRDKTLILWEVKTGKKLNILRGHGYYVYSAAFSLDGKKIISAGRTVRLWDAQTGRLLKVIDPNIGKKKEILYKVAFSSDGTKIIFTKGLEVKMWDIQAEKNIRTFVGHKDKLYYCGFSPDGTKVISAGEDEQIRIWEMNTGKLLAILKGHSDFINWCDFSPDGRRIVSCSSNGRVIIWDTRGRQLLTIKSVHNKIECCDFSPDGKTIAITDGFTTKLWAAQNWK